MWSKGGVAGISANDQKIKRDESIMGYYQMGTSATEGKMYGRRHLNNLDIFEKCSALCHYDGPLEDVTMQRLDALC